MKATLEREVKLRPGPDFGGVELDGRPLPGRTLVTSYYDTDDLRLAAERTTLRRRHEEDDGAVWQLKLPRAGGRLELEWDAPDDVVPDQVRTIVAGLSRGRRLSAVATLRTQRSGVVVAGDGVDLAEVVEDRVDVLKDGVVTQSFEEIEVELLDGSPKALRRLVRSLRRAGAQDAGGRTKLSQALGRDPAGIPEPPGKGARRLLAAMLAEQYREILAHDPGTRLGSDPEELHDLRSAIRRLRAYLRAGRPLLDRAWADDLRASLKRAGRTLAEARDLDVMLAHIERDAAGLDEPERTGARDLLEILSERRDRAHERLVAELCAPGYVSTLNRVEVAVAAVRFDGKGSLRRAAEKQHRRARRIATRLPDDPTDAQLHELRRAVRRSRYTAELAAACGTGGLGSYITRAKALQDVLGSHQDAVVAASVIRELDAEVHRPAGHLAAETLIRVQADHRAAARREAARAWKRADARAPGG